jgi:hypothetical protein
MPGPTASSPLVEGSINGTADNRLRAYAANCKRIPCITGAVVPEPVFTIGEYRERILAPIRAEIAGLDPEGILASEWVNARGAIARFERMALEIRVLDVQECPAMDLAFAQVVVAAVRALCDETWCDVATLARWDTDTLARYLGAAVASAEKTEIHDARYLDCLGCRTGEARIGQIWGVLAERAAAAGALDAAAERALEHYLRAGTLATRIVAALPEQPGRADLERVYRELCECLAAGRPFSAPSRRCR